MDLTCPSRVHRNKRFSEFSEPGGKQVFSRQGSQSPEAPENSVIKLVKKIR